MTQHKKVSRRDFLKLMTLAPAGLAARPLISLLDQQAVSGVPHVLIFVLDAWTAANVHQFGYHRQTMPALEKFAERCLVYHNHYSAGSFTVPGTASLLTGLYPWNHRAVQLSVGGVTPAHVSHNVFAIHSDAQSTFGYAQNPYADSFLYQFRRDLDTRLPGVEFNLQRLAISTLPVFKSDSQTAFVSFENNIISNDRGAGGSLFIGTISRLLALAARQSFRQRYIKEYPFGLPAAQSIFLLEDLMDGMAKTIQKFKTPTLAYFHAFPPHEPYAPQRDFAKLFKDDGWDPPKKPIHPLSFERNSWNETIFKRLRYDQYLATVDSEFAHVLKYLETSGMLEKSIVIITSDHGELFERGELGHNTPLLSSPVVHVPLLISLPGQTTRQDIHTFTSSVDILPTVASLVGTKSPAWAEGILLPGLGGQEDPNRAIYSIDAKTSSTFSAFEKYSISITKQNHRLIHYQYPYYSGFEFYDMDNDPEELTDLFPSSPKLALEMKDELLQKVADFNRPYQKMK